MRLIDADTLKRKEQKIATETWKTKIKASVEVILNQFIDHIDHAPTVDAVPVVRCGECKWARDYKGEMICGRVPLAIWTTMPERYCVDGERRTDADKETGCD